MSRLFFKIVVMKTSLCILFSFMLSHSFGQDQFTTAYTKIIAEVNQRSAAYANLKSATETIGHRLTGSEQGARAEQYAFDLLTSYGYDVHFQPFELVAWNRKSLALTIGGKMLKSVALAHSPVSAEVSSVLVDVGNGLEEDYQQKNVRGKIVLAYLQLLPGTASGTKNLHRSEKTAIAEKNGAAGVVFINAVKDGVLLTGTASITGDLIRIPAVCIGYEDGLAIKQQLTSATQVPVTIAMQNTADRVTARNIVATLKGKTPEKVVVGGHLDSWDLATGAIDNGIGSFAVLDMARALKKLKIKPKRTIEFVLFMGEEQGLLGSKAYVAQHTQANTLNQVRFMLNFDMTNAPTGFHSSRAEMTKLYANWLPQLQQVDTTFSGENVINAGLHSDHQPFMLSGIPYGGGAGGHLPNNAGAYYHSDNDVFGLVDQKGLEQTVKLGAILAYSLAQTEEIPAARLKETEIADYLEKNGLKIPLQVSGDWRWK